jgi:anthranilate synthase component 1
LNRSSILFFSPKIILKKDKKNLFFSELNNIWKTEKLSQLDIYDDDYKIPFFGGWFIYLGYEMAREIESKVDIPDSPFILPDAFAARVSTAIIYDNIKRKLFLVSDKKNGFEEDFENILDDISNINPDEIRSKTSGKIEVVSKGSKDEHQKQVRTCIDYIYEGEIFQANLSRLWNFKINKDISDIDIYRQLRFKNPSPFAALVRYGNSSIISSSPERLLSINKDHLETRPIAGTRPRGRSGLLDIELSNELINSDKEKAEHLMLVDLERNDISRVCIPGSVKVDEMMTIESYAHVHHIVSNISGKLKKNVLPLDAIMAVFPGGTITGCPKVRCMEILGELEKEGRGPYTGSIGYLTHNGNIDFNILIRTMLMEKQSLYFRAGGGIVADSIPQNETLETEAKANGMLRTVEMFSDE